MLISTVMKSELNEEFRIDSEYYSPENLKKEDAVLNQKYEYLGKLCDIISGPFGSTVTTDNYDKNSRKRYIRGKDIQNFFIDDTDPVYVEEKLFNELSQFHLKNNDLLLTVVGMKFGKAAIIDNNDNSSIFSCKSTLIRNPKINIWYLLAYLSSSVGYGLIRRGQRGAAQPGINLFDIQSVPVPIFSVHFQKQIEVKIQSAKDNINKASDALLESTDIVLTELNLSNWEPKHKLSFIKNFSDTLLTERLDAEYFHPRYEDIVKTVQNYPNGWDTLGNLCKLVGHPSNPPYTDTEQERKTFIVAQKNLGNYFLSDECWQDEDAKYTTDEFVKKNKQFLLRNEDLVLYTVGAQPHLGKANIIFDTSIQATIGSFVTLVRVDKNKINPFCLLAMFNSPVGYALTNRFQRGMVQQYIYPKDLVTTAIPIFPDEIQTQIQKKIIESFNFRKKSKHLLECSKRAVEIAIEQDEKTAIEWLKKQAEV